MNLKGKDTGKLGDGRPDRAGYSEAKVRLRRALHGGTAIL